MTGKPYAPEYKDHDRHGNGIQVLHMKHIGSEVGVVNSSSST